MVPHIQLMTRRQCCLCEDARGVIEEVAAMGLCTWEPVDVDRDKSLLVRYGLDVPVLVVNGRVIAKHRVDRQALIEALARLEEA